MSNVSATQSLNMNSKPYKRFTQFAHRMNWYNITPYCFLNDEITRDGLSSHQQNLLDGPLRLERR